MDRRSLMAGLAGATGLGLIIPTLFPIPVEMKALILGSGAIAATGNAAIAISDRKWQGHRAAVMRSEQLAIQERLSSQHAYQSVVQDSIAEIQLYQWVMAQPAQYRQALLAEHDLYKFLPQVEVVPAGEQPQLASSMAVTVPTQLMDQPSIGQQTEESTELDISWFADWEKRSGIICGESGDGKSKTLVYVLTRFLQANSNGQCQVYIGDPDYGSSHGDSEPNTWLGLKLGKHIAITALDIYLMVKHVSKIVDDRADQTAMAISQGQSKPKFNPVLFVLDEAPNVMGQLEEKLRDDVKLAIANILRRGLKQNVTFKLGTQSLAVGSLHLTQDLLRQIEIVMLWRAAQVAENYSNIGAKKQETEQITSSVGMLPRKLGDRFVCAVFAEKKLTIRGIPTIGEITITAAGESEIFINAEPPEAQPPIEDCYHLILKWIGDQGWNYLHIEENQKPALAAKWREVTGKSISPVGVEALIGYLAKL